MSEKILCIVTPADRTYYRVSEAAKEFLDKDGNVVHATGALPEGEFTEIAASSATVKHLRGGQLNGKVEVINLADHSVTLSEEYQNGKLVRVTTDTAPAPDKAVPLYAGTIVKTSQGTRSFYINGQQVAEENLAKDGVLELLGTIPDGEVKEFNENRQIIAEAHYQANKLHGLLTRYDDNGQVRSRENFRQGQLHGPAEYFFRRENKHFCAQCNYQENLLQGDFTVKDLDSGLVREQAHFIQGTHHGERLYYYENGNLEVQENFTNGVLHGERKIFYPNGALWMREEYRNGKTDGERIGYYQNGEMFLDEWYSDGVLHGERKTFAKDGSVILNEEYHWGDLIHNTETTQRNL